MALPPPKTKRMDYVYTVELLKRGGILASGAGRLKNLWDTITLWTHDEAPAWATDYVRDYRFFDREGHHQGGVLPSSYRKMMCVEVKVWVTRADFSTCLLYHSAYHSACDELEPDEEEPCDQFEIEFSERRLPRLHDDSTLRRFRNGQMLVWLRLQEAGRQDGNAEVRFIEPEIEDDGDIQDPNMFADMKDHRVLQYLENCAPFAT